jgi:uncharacterized protein (UPF0332 family)
MNNEQLLLLEKARESLKAAQILLNNQLPDFATSRAYYTMFYIAEAFLLKNGLTYSSHAAVISGFGREFAKTKRIPVDYHRYLIEAQQKRTEADYNLKPNISFQEAQDIIDKAKNLLDFAYNNIDKI